MKFTRAYKSRAKLRLNASQYPISASYFITISCFENQPKFGHIENGKMILNDFGKIAHDTWYSMIDKFPNAENVIVQIMPNHFHALLHVLDLRYAVITPLNTDTYRPQCMEQQSSLPTSRSYPIPAISEIIGAYKSVVTLKCLKKFKADFIAEVQTPHMGKIWHRSFWERVIRDNIEFENVKNYIENNPIKWSPKINNQNIK